METPQGSDLMPIVPHWFQWPQASVGNVTWADEDLQNHALHFVSKLFFLFNMQLCGFHCINGYSICILVIFPYIFINYCNYRVNHREFLWLVVASRCQMSSDMNILHHSYQQLVNITRNGLNTKRSLYFSAYFTFLFILVNFPLTGNDLCHFQPNGIFFHYF